MKGSAKLICKFGVVVLVVSLFSGCKFITDFFKKKDTKKVSVDVIDIDDQTGPVIATVGKKEIKESALLAHEEQMKQMNPYLRGAAKLPNPLRRKIFQNLLDQEVIIAWMDQNNIEENKEFLDRLEKMMKMVKRHLKVQTFEADIHKSVNVLGSDVKDYYNKNKDKFIKNSGKHGTLVSGVKFEKEEDADAFLAKVKGKNKEAFDKIAQETKTGEFRNFGWISEKKPEKNGFSFEDKATEKVRAFADKIDRLPKIEKKAIEKEFWVLIFADRKAPEYATFDEAKENIEGMLKGNKVREAITKKLEDIKKEFTIDVNEDYFKDEEPAANQKDKKESRAAMAA
jgi:hypothetical protein